MQNGQRRRQLQHPPPSSDPLSCFWTTLNTVVSRFSSRTSFKFLVAIEHAVNLLEDVELIVRICACTAMKTKSLPGKYCELDPVTKHKRFRYFICLKSAHATRYTMSNNKHEAEWLRDKNRWIRNKLVLLFSKVPMFVLLISDYSNCTVITRLSV